MRAPGTAVCHAEPECLNYSACESHPCPTACPPAALSIVVPTYNERDRLADLVDAIFDAYAAEELDGELVDRRRQLARRHRRARRRARQAPSDHGDPPRRQARARHGGHRRLRRRQRADRRRDRRRPEPSAAAAAAHARGRCSRRTPTSSSAAATFPAAARATGELGRLLMSRFACLMARGLTPVRDATSGFFLIRRDLARGVRSRPAGSRSASSCWSAGGRRSVVEVPYVFAGRTAGESKMNTARSARLPRPAARLARASCGSSRRCAQRYRAAYRRSASARAAGALLKAALLVSTTFAAEHRARDDLHEDRAASRRASRATSPTWRAR